MVNGRKKRAEKAQRRHQKEQEIAQCVWARENRSDVEAELELEEPTKMGDHMSASEDEGVRGAVVSSVERC